MKKIISMFAFVAIMVLGAVSLASCDKNDSTDTGVNDKHKFTYRGAFYSDNATKEALDIVNKHVQSVIDSDPYFKPLTCTEGDASIYWFGEFENSVNSLFQGMVDENAKKLNDPTLTFTLKMIEDGNKEFKTKTWKPSPLLFL